MATTEPDYYYDGDVLKVKKTYTPNPLKGRGGAPTRETTLPTDPALRKRFPVASGVLDYFPDALLAVAEVSYVGNQQHNPGQPLFWNREKSSDESDALVRHMLARGTRDSDGLRHSAKLAWRALANLQKEIEAEQKQAQMNVQEKQYEKYENKYNPGSTINVDNPEQYIGSPNKSSRF